MSKFLYHQKLWDCIVSILEHTESEKAGLGKRSQIKTGKVDSLFLYMKWQTDRGITCAGEIRSGPEQFKTATNTWAAKQK